MKTDWDGVYRVKNILLDNEQEDEDQLPPCTKVTWSPKIWRKSITAFSVVGQLVDWGLVVLST